LERSASSVLLVDDHQRWRGYVFSTLQKHSEVEIIGEASDGPEAIEKAKALQPDLIMLDIGLPTLNGIEAARRIREVSPTSRILFVSENCSTDIVEEALSTGADGYVVKSDAHSDLLPAIKAVLEGKRFISACLAGHFLVTATLSTAQTMLSLIITFISGIH
jgi:DNA-binding NarL/FixJ family response regulator